MDEQTEAAIADELRKTNVELYTTLFKVRKDFYTGLLSKGMSKPAVNKIVGSMTISVPDKQYGEEIYLAALEASIENICKLYKLYSNEMSEEIFIEIASNFLFRIPDV